MYNVRCTMFLKFCGHSELISEVDLFMQNSSHTSLASRKSVRLEELVRDASQRHTIRVVEPEAVITLEGNDSAGRDFLSCVVVLYKPVL